MTSRTKETLNPGLPGWLNALWVPVIFTLITLVMTYPAILHLSDRILSHGDDTWIFWWNNWWVKEALTRGGTPLFTERMFFPQGVDLSYHSFSWLNTALWLVLEPVLGDVAAYNLSILWVFPLAGWGMERLVHHLTGSKGAAFFAGLIYAFVPYRIGQCKHLTLMGTQWIPFYTLSLLRAIDSWRWRHVLGVALFLVLTALVGWNPSMHLAVWTCWIAGNARVSRRVGIRLLCDVLVPVAVIVHSQIHRSMPLPCYPLSQLSLFKLPKSPDWYTMMPIFPAAGAKGIVAADPLACLRRRRRAPMLVGLSALQPYARVSAPVEPRSPRIGFSGV